MWAGHREGLFSAGHVFKQQYVGYEDLEPSLVDVCNCMQRAEEHFVTLVVFWTQLHSAALKTEESKLLH